jgi:hypothetical protein
MKIKNNEKSPVDGMGRRFHENKLISGMTKCKERCQGNSKKSANKNLKNEEKLITFKPFDIFQQIKLKIPVRDLR